MRDRIWYLPSSRRPIIGSVLLAVTV
jgi:hypothetical protein